MGKLSYPLLIAAVTLAATGCRSVARPDWFQPGPATYQQSRAERFDPYPENEIGPQIVGARPRDYQIPPSEPSRARWIPWSWGRR